MRRQQPHRPAPPGHRTIRVDWEVADELYRRRRPRERNHNGVIRRALAASGNIVTITQRPPKGGERSIDMTEISTELMVCLDGVEEATLPLIDGNDPFNAEAERGALDRAYELKESNPDTVVSIVIVRQPEGPSEATDDAEFIADNLAYLASVDEGENTNSDRLWALSQALRRRDLRVEGAVADEPTEA